MIGINLSGAEFGTDDRYGFDYFYPSAAQLGYYAERGITVVRLPFKWERMQPTLGGPLDQGEFARLTTVLRDAEAHGMKVIIDLHNSGRFGDDVLGSDAVSNAQFADFWSKLASALRGEPALAGYGLMNEPHDMGGVQVWPAAAQAAVDAIRSVDMTTAIYVAGNAWSSAWTWQQSNADLAIVDPAKNLYYEAHLYFDRWASGTYVGSYDAEGAYADLGVDRLKPFVEWLAAHGAKGFIGEFGVPSDDPRWLELLDRFLSAMQDYGLDGTAWGGGFGWDDDYKLALGAPDTGDGAAFRIIRNYAEQKPGLARLGTGTGDSMDGTALADTLQGGGGSDLLAGGAGGDRLDGGSGTDTASYAASVTSVDVDLMRATQKRGDAQGDMLAGIENLRGSAGADTLRGNAGVNSLRGGDGDDLLEGGSGGDMLDGGDGIDSVSYASSAAGVVVDLPKAVQSSGDAAMDSLTAIENIIGSRYADRLHGDAGRNTLSGGKGADSLEGRGGSDVLSGGAGNDLFIFGSVADARGDHVTDFTPGDIFDLSAIDAKDGIAGDQGFTTIGSRLFSGVEGELRVFRSSSPAETYVQGDTNGDGAPNFQFALHGLHQLVPTDFLL